MKKTALLVSLVFLLDQLSKTLVEKEGGVVVRNRGIAFGLFPNFTWEIVVFLILLGFLIGVLRGRGRFFSLGAGFVLGGGFSNLFDRLRFGYIRDFVNLKILPVFNFADLAVCLGIGLFLWEELWGSCRQV